ncbi:OLC1v1020618C1 [Oldenlandia corymbosa var. corymbosa]|uniref:OLC1v1020618C1 n=1 Tax=Oldenlandia corymbosa var. corymbosa TaxID=529605 RepID=A0AAV1EGT5_OLDCO|nr:OLC1v1020618C1 [Oldenlandia corymbosa var. corymbosa]
MVLEMNEDDDFGDLYTDIKAKASPEVTKLLPVEGDEEEENLDIIEANECENGNVSENGDSSQSESEDELKIVVNDDDVDDDHREEKCVSDSYNNSKVNSERVGFDDGEMEEDDDRGGGRGGCNGGGGVAHFKLMRSKSRPGMFSNNMKSFASAGVASYSSTMVGDNWEEKSCGPDFRTCSIGDQRRLNISLPRSSTILDVDIDVLEWKPWRHPGADITDFFNFGLDEDSWKSYCKRLDELRGKRGANANFYRADKPLGHNKKTLAEGATEIDASSRLKIAHPPHEKSPTTWQAEKPKGKAIQVEEGIGERQPSTDVWHPVVRDFDFINIIQIPVQDTDEDFPNSAKGAVDKVAFAQEASDVKESGDIPADDGGDMICLCESRVDGLPTLEVSSDDTPNYSLARCTKQISPLNPACMESHLCGQASEADKLCVEETLGSDSDCSSVPTRSSDYLKESVSDVGPFTASCRKDLESPYSEQSLRSPGLSPCQGDNVASRYGAYIEQAGKFKSHTKRESRNSESEVRETGTYGYHSLNESGRSHALKVKPSDYRGQSPVLRNNKIYQKKSSRKAEFMSYSDNRDSLYASDPERFHVHPTSGYCNWRKKHKGFGYSERESFLCYKGSEQPSYCRGEKFCDYQLNDDFGRNSHYRASPNTGYDRDLRHRQNFPGKRIQRSTNDVLEKMINQFESRPSVEMTDSLCYDGSGQFIAEELPLPESRNLNRRKWIHEELPFKRRKRNNFVPERIYSYEFTRENYRCIESGKRETDVIELEYDRPLSYTRREVETSIRIQRKFENPLDVYGTVRHRDYENKTFRDIENEFPFSSWRKYCTNGRRSGRNDVVETQGIRMRENFCERYHERKFGGWSDVLHNDDIIENLHDEDDFSRRRPHFESEVLPWGQEKYRPCHADIDLPADERTWNPLTKNLRSKRSDARYDKGSKLIVYESEHNMCKQLRKRSYGSQYPRNSYSSPRDIVRRGFQGSWNSTDKHMVVWNRKSTRYFGGNARHDNSLNWNDHSGQRNFEDSDDYQSGIIVGENHRNNNSGDLSRVDKYTDTTRHHCPDVEGGHIIAKKETCTSKDTSGIAGSENLSSNKPRIQEMMDKMEKRRERFKQSLGVASSEKNDKPDAADKVTETAEKTPQKNKKLDYDDNNDVDDEGQVDNDDDFQISEKKIRTAKKSLEELLVVRRPVMEFYKEEREDGQEEEEEKEEANRGDSESDIIEEEEKPSSSSSFDDNLTEFARKMPIFEPTGRVQSAVSSEEKPLAVNLDLALYRAKILGRNYQFQAAEKILQKCIEIWPEDGRSYVALGKILSKQSKMKEARAVYEKGCQATQGENPYIWQCWAVLENKMGNVRRARELFDASTVADKRHAAAWHGWAVLELKQGNIKKARSLLGKGLKYCGGNEYIYQTLALLEAKAKRYEQARYLFKQATKCNPKSCASWLAWAQLEAQQENNHEARRLFEKAVQASPKNRFAWHVWGVFESNLGNIDKGRKLLKIGHAVNPRDPVLLQSLALLEYKYSSPYLARTLFRKASQLDPRHQPVWIAWGWMEWKEGNISKARELYQKALSINSTTESAARCLQAWGVLEQRLGNLSAARRLFRSSLNINSQSYVTWMTWASLEEDQGNSDRADEIRNLYFQQRTEVVDDASWVMGFLDIIDPAIDSIKRLLNLDQSPYIKSRGDPFAVESATGLQGAEDDGRSSFDLDKFVREMLRLDPSTLEVQMETPDRTEKTTTP